MKSIIYYLIPVAVFVLASITFLPLNPLFLQGIVLPAIVGLIFAYLKLTFKWWVLLYLYMLTGFVGMFILQGGI